MGVGPARYSSAAGNGVLSWMRTCSGPTTSTFLIQSVFWRVAILASGPLTTLKVKATSSAASGSPLWNFTPGRSVTSSAVGDSHFHAVASWGLSSPVLGSR